MRFADDYLAQLERLAERVPLPRLRALHLPPLPEQNPDNLGEFCAVELDDGSIGLSYALLDDTLAQLQQHHGRRTVDWRGQDALAAARAYRDDRSGRRAVGFAAANALTQWLMNRSGFRRPDSTDSIGQIDPQAGESIGMIGLFTPLVKRVTARGARLTVVELNPAWVGEHPDHRVTLDREALRDCDKILSTSTLLLNDSLDDMLAVCRRARVFAMLGPSAGCLPDALFRRGVTLLGGSEVHDRERFLDALHGGEAYAKTTRKTVLTPDLYPGFEALLARLTAA